MAKPLGRAGRRWLLGLHVLVGGAWIGGVVALVLVSHAARRPATGEALALGRVALQYLDYGLIIPSCLASLATGFLSSWLTPWGFFKHRWVTVKWVATVAMILFGTFFLGPWVDESAALATRHGLGALADPTFVAFARRVAAFGVLQAVILVAVMFVSTLKPWSKKDARGAE